MEGINARVLRNSGALMASQVYVALVALVLASQLPRYLGEAGYGMYSEVYAFVGLFDVIGQLGLRVIVTRQIARRKEQATHLLGQVLTLKLPLAVMALTAVMAATLVRPTTSFERFLIAICVVESLVRGYSNTINGVLRAFELMGYNLVITIVDRTLAVGAVLAAVRLRLDLTAVFLGFLVSACGRLVAAAWLCWRQTGRPKWGGDLSLWRWFVQEAWPVGLSNALARAYDGAGIVLLGVANGATGLLAGGLRINRITAMLGVSITDALFPVLARSSAGSSEQLRRIAREALALLLGLVLPLAAFYATFSGQFVPWFLGPQFAAASSVVAVLSPALVSSFVFMFLASALTASGQQRLVTLSQALGLAANVAGNVILIPRYGVLGPALALLASEAASLAVVLLPTGRLLGLPNILRGLAPAALGTVGMIAVWRGVPVASPFLVRTLLGGVAYCSLWGTAAMIDPSLRAFLQRLAGEAAALLGRRAR